MAEKDEAKEGEAAGTPEGVDAAPVSARTPFRLHPPPHALLPHITAAFTPPLAVRHQVHTVRFWLSYAGSSLSLPSTSLARAPAG
eukprot:1849622-Rhodomonas_salina.2